MGVHSFRVILMFTLPGRPQRGPRLRPVSTSWPVFEPLPLSHGGQGALHAGHSSGEKTHPASAMTRGRRSSVKRVTRRSWVGRDLSSGGREFSSAFAVKPIDAQRPRCLG